MTRNSARDIIKNRLGNRTGTDLENLIVSEMQLAQTDLELEPWLPWFLYKTTQSDVATQTFAVESDFLREVQEISGLAIVESDGWKVLIKANHDRLCVDDNLKEAAEPSYYSLINETYTLFPAPETSYTIQRRYYAKAVALTSDVENAWLKYCPNFLIALTGLRVGRWLRDEAGVQMWMAEFTSSRNQLMQADAAYRAAGLKPVLEG